MKHKEQYTEGCHYSQFNIDYPPPTTKETAKGRELVLRIYTENAKDRREGRRERTWAMGYIKEGTPEEEIEQIISRHNDSIKATVREYTSDPNMTALMNPDVIQAAMNEFGLLDGIDRSASTLP